MNAREAKILALSEAARLLKTKAGMAYALKLGHADQDRVRAALEKIADELVARCVRLDMARRQPKRPRQ